MRCKPVHKEGYNKNQMDDAVEVEQNHPSKPVYPSLRQIKELGLTPQHKEWEEM